EAHGAGGASRVAVGHVVADDLARLGGGVLGAALAFSAGDDLAAHMALVDLVADHATGDRAGRGGGLLALAAADLVANQAADDGAGHGAADVAVTLRQALLPDPVLPHFVRHALAGRLAHRVGGDHGAVALSLLGHRGDRDDVGVFQRRLLRQQHLAGRGITL